MAGLTEHYGFQTLVGGESLATGDYKFTKADREQMDRLLFIGAEGHHHTGDPSTGTDPTVAPGLVQAATGGAHRAGRRIYYKYSLIDLFGNESLPSPEAYVDTPAPIVEPSAPALATMSTTGTLIGGTYFYVLSAYQVTSTSETLALTSGSTTTANTNTNKNTLTLPSLPAGATGFNIYRKRPGASKFYFLASTTSASFVDDGSIAEDCDRSLPTENTTNSTNKVTITLSGAVPVGMTWKLYRTFVNGDYDNSLVHHVVEETAVGSGIITNTYVDIGNPTTTGRPSERNQVVGSPEKIDLEDGTEIQGRLPMSQVSGYPHAEPFLYKGPLAVTTGEVPWLCPFPNFRITGVRCTLGKGSVATGSDVIVDVNKGTGTTPTYTTIFTTAGNRPKVTVGNQVGAVAVPDVIELVAGDTLTVDIDAVDSGGPAENIVIVVYGIVYGYTDPNSVVW